MSLGFEAGLLEAACQLRGGVEARVAALACAAAGGRLRLDVQVRGDATGGGSTVGRRSGGVGRHHPG